MAQTNINIRIDEELEKQFEMSNEPFYSESNIKYLEKVIDDIETGRTELEEHELIEKE